MASCSEQSCQNGYLLFFARASSGDKHPTAEESMNAERSCGDALHAACSDSDASREEVDSNEAELCSSDLEGHDESEDNLDTDANDTEGHDESDADQANSRDDAHHAAVEYQVQAIECRATSSRHDDWLHRGPFLADLPWHAYMMRVQRARKPSEPGADYSQYFFFDTHYSLSALYCQELRYNCCNPTSSGIGVPSRGRRKRRTLRRIQSHALLSCSLPLSRALCRPRQTRQ